VRDGKVLLLRPDPPTAGDLPDAPVAPEWAGSVFEEGCARLPVLRETSIDAASCWAGLYEMSPDHHCLLGAVEECENFYLINGASGHRVMHAPALGQLLAEIISDGKAATLDASPLRPSRFAEGRPNPCSMLL